MNIKNSDTLIFTKKKKKNIMLTNKSDSNEMSFE